MFKEVRSIICVLKYQTNLSKAQRKIKMLLVPSSVFRVCLHFFLELAAESPYQAAGSGQCGFFLRDHIFIACFQLMYLQDRTRASF